MATNSSRQSKQSVTVDDALEHFGSEHLFVVAVQHGYIPGALKDNRFDVADIERVGFAKLALQIIADDVRSLQTKRRCLVP